MTQNPGFLPRFLGSDDHQGNLIGLDWIAISDWLFEVFCSVELLFLSVYFYSYVQGTKTPSRHFPLFDVYLNHSLPNVLGS